MNSVLILNADLGPLHWVSLRHAICMLFREVAVVHEAEPGRLFGGIYPHPRALRLTRYVDTRWRYGSRPPWSRSGVLTRDGHRCGYCGAIATTVDHVLPRSRGGNNSWTNTVAACLRCNQRKGDRTPKEVGLRLHAVPRTPTWSSLVVRRKGPSAVPAALPASELLEQGA